MINSIRLLKPKPYEKVGPSFLVYGEILDSSLDVNLIQDKKIFLDILGIDCKSWRSGQDVDVKARFLFKKKYFLKTFFNFFSTDLPWIKNSQGRLTLKLSTRQDNEALYVPIILRGFEPLEGLDEEIVKKHGRVGETINKYKTDLENYYKELEEIRLNNEHKVNISYSDEWMTIIDIEDEDILIELLKVLSSSTEEFEKLYKIAKQAQAEKLLEKKYEDAIKWRGSLLRGAVHRWRGFVFRVYSNDHDRHLHVVHREKGIDARFSFPEIELIDYKKSKKIISTKEEKDIREIFQNPRLFEKLKKEFERVQKI